MIEKSSTNNLVVYLVESELCSTCFANTRCWLHSPEVRRFLFALAGSGSNFSVTSSAGGWARSFEKNVFLN